ncbi:hypothetical protein TRIATDRAFT_282935 [Trichoderma atroviride IMI 206040]|uniref:Uncharacterized protein n=1 Tax=Hypocrea atroviridis (strain ATCC 20476 / IMI 206040) TaxID=452589 RepID=G9NSM2_HYPAI|nr:uncharacterized protein TRIATDRAFT_282935 [Trichoderma atroviride IMI 206040]EHK46419.1 hypothetical protein TRIATDRAFT_282935 [Trichoderma atroviride IMI 206040]
MRVAPSASLCAYLEGKSGGFWLSDVYGAAALGWCYLLLATSWHRTRPDAAKTTDAHSGFTTKRANAIRFRTVLYLAEASPCLHSIQQQQQYLMGTLTQSVHTRPLLLQPSNLPVCSPTISVTRTSPGPGPPSAWDSDGDRGFADLTAAVFHPTPASAESLELSNSGLESLIMGAVTVLQRKTTHGVRRLYVPESLSPFGPVTPQPPAVLLEIGRLNFYPRLHAQR